VHGVVLQLGQGARQQLAGTHHHHHHRQDGAHHTLLLRRQLVAAHVGHAQQAGQPWGVLGHGHGDHADVIDGRMVLGHGDLELVDLQQGVGGQVQPGQHLARHHLSRALLHVLRVITQVIQVQRQAVFLGKRDVEEVEREDGVKIGQDLLHKGFPLGHMLVR